MSFPFVHITDAAGGSSVVSCNDTPQVNRLRCSARRLTLWAAICVVGTPITRAVAQSVPADPGPLEIRLSGLRLQSLLADHAEFTAEVSVLAHAAAKLEDIQFRSVRLDNQIPAFVEPLTGSFALSPGAFLALPPVRITLYFADLPSATRLQSMLDESSVKLTGEVRAEMHLSLLGKIAVLDLHPTAVLILNQDVPLRRESVDTTTQLGVGLLALAQKAIGASTSLLSQLSGTSVTAGRSDAEARRYASSIVLVRTTYRMRGRSSEVHQCERLGFWVRAHDVLIPEESLEPWAFSAEAANIGGKVDKASVEISVQSLRGTLDQRYSAAPAPWIRSKGDFTIARRGTPTRNRLVAANRKVISVLEEGSSGNFAVLHFDHATGNALPRSEDMMPAEDNLLILQRQSGGGLPLRSLLVTSRGSEAIGLSRALDESTFGSPAISGRGAVVGLVVAEGTVIPISSLPLD